MKSNIKKLVILLIIGLVFPLIINFNFNLSSNYQPIIENPKTSGTYIGIWIDDTLPFNGSNFGNWAWARTQPWCTEGDGTKEYPYVIKDSTFLSPGLGDCLMISNSRKYFAVRNCTLKDMLLGGFGGLRLDNVTNGQIIDNQIYNNYFGIYLNGGQDNIIAGNNASLNNIGIWLSTDCSNNTLSGNTANNNDDTGIYLDTNCDDNTISENNASLNNYGITLDSYCSRNTLSGNTANDNTGYGITLNYCDDNTISGNTANDNTHFGIYLSHSNYTNIMGNIANYNDDHGIWLSTNCNNNTISDNTANYNEDDGIRLETNCDDNTISGNTASENTNYYGIELYHDCDNNTLSGNTVNKNLRGIHSDYCDDNTISGNTANNNTQFGIYLHQSHYTNITGNTANYNEEDGIYLENNCDNNILSENTASENTNYYGIALYLDCDNNTLSGNTVNKNLRGIHLASNCDDNTISDNTANYNTWYGIYLHQSQYTNITGNTANYNEEDGIYLENNCDYSDIIDNIFYNNTQGIHIASGCDNNSIYKNFFLENGIHAIDDGTDNTWNSTSIGNYWDNWTSPDDPPQDGIVDDPYIYIGGSAGSIDYLPIAEDGAPQITINSPNDDDLFESNAPSYDVIITDVYLVETWYSLDGGLHNYIFTEFTGTIDQSVWDAISDGSITFTVYASDLIGNIGSAELSIEKDTQAPTITINSPSAGSEFGTTAPDFVITVTDDHLDSIWYSLDGGLTTFDITTNSTIDQAAWAALSEGSITITFYANDTLGNLTFEEVTITKSIPAGGIDPTIIIVIVVMSIVGGVAVIAGIYIFMKKRGTPE